MKQNLWVWFDQGSDGETRLLDFSVLLPHSSILRQTVFWWLQDGCSNPPRPRPSFLIHIFQKRADSAFSETSNLQILCLLRVYLDGTSLSGWKGDFPFLYFPVWVYIQTHGLSHMPQCLEAAEKPEKFSISGWEGPQTLPWSAPGLW